MTEAEKRMREIYAQELDRDGEGMAAFLWRDSEPAHPDSSNGRIIRAMLAAEAAAIERMQPPIAWCIEQAGEIMAISAGCADTHGDPGGGLQMINSIASDIAINLQMTESSLKEGASHVG